MSYKKLVNTNFIVNQLMHNFIFPGSIAIDCTVGNGKDTVILAELVGSTGKVYGLDKQQVAIDNTLNLLNRKNFEDRVVLINDSHENIDNYIKEKADFIIYNLGYLPGGNKAIKTNISTTIKSLKKALMILNNNGLLVITVYVGHDGGLEEKVGIEKLLMQLNQKEFNVLKYDFINQINYPPVLYGVERLILGGEV